MKKFLLVCELCTILVLCSIAILPLRFAHGAQVAASGFRSLYLDDAGIVWELVPPAKVFRPILDNVQTVVAAHFYGLALRKNGELWGWGPDILKILAREPKHGVPKNTPLKILDNVVHVVSGVGRVFAIRADGSLWGWGDSELGMGVKSKKRQGMPPAYYNIPPTRILPPTVLHVAAGCSTVVLLKNVDSTQPDIFMGWGENQCAQLGNYDDDSSITPKIINIEEFKGKRLHKIFAAAYYGLALMEGGDVWMWGALGIMPCSEGTHPDRLSPKKIVGVSDIVDISASSLSICMLRNDATLWGVGRAVPTDTGWGWTNTAIKIMSDIQSASFGSGHLLVVKKDGTLWGLGSNTDGQLGRPLGEAPYEWYAEPVQIVIPPLKEADTSKFVQ